MAELALTARELQGHPEALSFPDESFDVVISKGVIDLIPDKAPSSTRSSASCARAAASRAATSHSRIPSARRGAETHGAVRMAIVVAREVPRRERDLARRSCLASPTGVASFDGWLPKSGTERFAACGRVVGA